MSSTQTVAQAIDAFARGDLVIVTDDNDRENEGDLVCAASLCTPEKMAFIIRHCCGIVCAPITAYDAKRLHLSPMVGANDAPLGTAFTVTVDVRHGLTTGISAEQRTNTVRALANGNMGASDFVRPGHVFPLIAREGGVLMRSGHTEAAVDLCRLANLPTVGVICELANDDGTVMAGDQITRFAEAHDIKRISVADLIAYRQSREKLVERVATFPVEGENCTLIGHAYVTPFDAVQHFAFVHGDIGDGRDMPTRLHRVDIIADVITAATTSRKCSRASSGKGGACSSTFATARPAFPHEPAHLRSSPRMRHVPCTGGRSGSGRRSCGISVFDRSDCGPRRREPTSACRDSASRSPPTNRLFSGRQDQLRLIIDCSGLKLKNRLFTRLSSEPNVGVVLLAKLTTLPSRSP